MAKLQYALKQRSQGQITLSISAEPTPEAPPGAQTLTVCLEFRDDGPGYPEPVLHLEDIDVGLQLIEEIVRRDLRGHLNLHNDHGAVTRIFFRVSEGGMNQV